MNIIGIIPARMGSTRFPGKPLAKIHGIPMIGHIYYKSKRSKVLNGVYIATCDKEIADYAQSIGAEAIMTKSTHRGCIDRCVEATIKIEKKHGKKIDIVIILQGDEPMIKPEMIDGTIQPLIKDKNLLFSNLGLSITTQEEYEDENVVKVVVDKKDNVLYFSREPIPSQKKAKTEVPMRKQTGIIAFRKKALIQYGKLKPTPLELIESVDMLRPLENGYKVKMVFLNYSLFSVDTPADLIFVRRQMKKERYEKI